MSFLTKDGLHLYSKSYTSPQSVGSIAILHGLGEHSGRYEHFAQYLVANRFNVHTFDLRGHGRSQGLRGHVDNFSSYHDDIECFFEHLEEEGSLKHPLVLFGHSLGGLILLDYLLNFLDIESDYYQGAIFSAPALSVTTANLPLKYALCKLAPSVLRQMHISNGIDPDDLSHVKKNVTQYREDPLVHKWVTASLFQELIDTQVRLEETELRLKIPTLFMVPGKDRIVDPEAVIEFADELDAPNKEVITFPTSFHEVLHEKTAKHAYDKTKTWLENLI